MGVDIKLGEVTLREPVRIYYGVTGLELSHAQSIMRDKVRDNWPDQYRPAQSVYVIRVIGQVAVSYPRDWSPVIYIGEGNAYERVEPPPFSWTPDIPPTL